MNNRTAFWVALVVALVVVGALVSYIQRDRFDSGGEAAPGVTEAVATLVAVGDCPWGEASCILAQGIERALQRGNVEAVMGFGASQFYICPGGNGGPQPLCAGVGADEGRRGYPVARRAGGDLVLSEDATRQRLQGFVSSVNAAARDEVGSGALRLYAFTCDRRALRVQPVSCAHLGIVLSAIVGEGQAQQREVLVFWAVGGFAGRSLPFTEVWDGAVAAHELPVLFQAGGSLEDLGDVHVIDQSKR